MGRNFYILIIGIFLINKAFGQVGIGNTNPNATLDISSSDQTAPNNTDGILIPKIDEFPLTNPGENQDGMLVYATGVGTPQKGFYFWDNSAVTWILITGYPEWNLLGNTGTDSSINFLGTTDDQDLVFKRYGIESGRINTTNTSLGVNSMMSNTSGNRNVAIGLNALQNNTGGSGNVAIGVDVLESNSTGANNIAIGRSLISNTTGINNIAIGASSMNNNTTGYNNVAIGVNSLLANSVGFSNTAVGTGALQRNTTGEDNVGIGFIALNSNTTGRYNVAIGRSALFSNTTGTGNTANGGGALYSNTTGSSNTAVGSNSLSRNTTGSFNTSNGQSSLFFNTTGRENSALGYQSLYFNTTGENNTATGYQSLNRNTTGNSNAVYGHNAAFSNDAGSNNTIIGARAFVGNRSGDSNVAIGFEALTFNQTGSNNVAIGYNAGKNEMSSNKLYIESSDADSTGALIYGEFDSDILRINGEIQVGVPSSTGYSLPITDGSTNQTLKTDGSGTLNWTNSVYQSFLDTGVTTGNYIVSSEDYTVRVSDNVSGITIPDAATHTNRIIIIIGSNGITSKPFTFSGGGIFDDVTNTNITSINANERFTIQSDGSQWIVIGN